MHVLCEFQVLKIWLLNLPRLLEVSAEGAFLKEVCGKLAEEKHTHNFQQMKDEAAIVNYADVCLWGNPDLGRYFLQEMHECLY